MTKSVRFALFVVCSLVVSTKPVSADTIYFNDFTHSGSVGVDWLVSINDDTVSVFTVNVAIDDSSPNQFADITGIAFSIDGAIDGGLWKSHIVDVTRHSDFVKSYVGPNDRFGSGQGQVNFQGGTPSVGFFDAALGYKAGRKMLTAVEFTVSTLDGLLGLEDWTKFGVRAQSVGANCFGDGSTKDWAMRSNPSSVPTPSAVVGLLGMGCVVGGVRLWRRR